LCWAKEEQIDEIRNQKWEKFPISDFRFPIYTFSVSFITPKNVQTATGVLFGVVLVSLLYFSIREPKVPPPDVIEEEDCVGEAIVVDYDYQGGVNTPHECKIQCEDDEPRYILYANGMATQCEDPPGCIDAGEDDGITCTPPAAMSIES